MSNSILQEFEPLDVLVSTIAPRCGISARELDGCILGGVTSNAVRFSIDGREPIEWSQSDFAHRESARGSRTGGGGWSINLDNVGGFDVFDDDFGAKHSHGWHEKTPLDRFRKAASSGGTIRIELRSAMAFLRREYELTVELPSPDSINDRPRSKGGRKPILPWRDMVTDLVAEMQDGEGDGRMTSGQAEEWAIQWAAEQDVTTERSTVQPYVREAFDAFDRWTERRYGKRAGN